MTGPRAEAREYLIAAKTALSWLGDPERDLLTFTERKVLGGVQEVLSDVWRRLDEQ